MAVGATPLWPLVFYAALVLAAVSGMVIVSALLGPKHKDPATGEPYESGILPEGTARLRFSAKFYLVAMAFVIFDLESAFIFAWAAAWKGAGWAGYAGLLVFVGLLVAGLIYEWRSGVLDWAVQKRKVQ